MGHLDPPDDLEPPDWYAMIEEALDEPDIPDPVAVAIRKILDDWSKPADYPDYYAPLEELPDNGCRTCGKPTGCVYCSDTCTPDCGHGNRPGDCDACDHLGDQAYDADRESR